MTPIRFFDEDGDITVDTVDLRAQSEKTKQKNTKHAIAVDSDIDSVSVDTLLQNTGLWRASSIDCELKKCHSSGFPVLDGILPGSGWPSDGVTEILHNQYGVGEFRLLTPALARMSHEQSRWILLVSPPYIPYPPALMNAGVDLANILIAQPKNQKDYLWVLEKALASQSCSAVLAWPNKIHSKQIRRLQVASKEGHCWNVLFRNEREAKHASPAELRIHITACRPSPLQANSAVNLKVLKRRGGWQSELVRIDFEDHLNIVTPDFSELVIQRSHRVIPEKLPLIEAPDSRLESHYEYQ